MTIKPPSPVDLPPARQGQTFSGYIRQHLDAFEELQRVGMPYDALVEALVQVGWQVSNGVLNTALYRARKQRSHSMPTNRRPALPVAHQALTTSAGPASVVTRRPVTLTPTKDLKLEDLF